MCQPKKWWLGLLPLALLWVLANWFSTGRIEADIGQRTVEVLKGAALDKPNILVQGRDVTLSGQAFVDGESKKDAILAANQNGVRLAVDATSLVPEVKPYAWSVTRDGAKVTLAGNVPNPEVRAALNAAAKKAFAGAEIADTMTYGRGAPACLAAASGLGFNTLAGLAKGSVALAGEVVGVQGEAREFAGYDSALAALKTPLEGCTVKGAEAILPPEIKPYAWSATHSGNTLTITGYVPDAAARTAIGAAAKAALPGVSIVDTTRIARGAPATLVAGAAYGLGQLANLGDGSATLTDASLALSGEAASPAKFAALAEAAKSAPGGVTVSVPAVRAAEVKPFAWSAIRTAEGVTLTGYAPSAGAQVRILAAAKAALPGLAITDKTLVARGAPGGIETATSYALGELARLSAGSVGLVDSAYTIAGEAPTPEVFATAQKALATVPAGFALASDMIRAPEVARFDWSAVRTAEGVTLGGFAPSVGAKARIFSAAKAAFPGVPVADTMLVARGAPAGIEAATTYALGELAHLTTGSVGLSGTSYSIAGEAPTPLSYGASIDALKALPPGFVLGTDMIRAPEVSGFNWQAVRDGETVTLEGYAPSLGAQARILAAAKAALPGVTVVDNTLVARGAPAGIEAAASYALGEVARLSNGVASVRDTAISVSGEGMSSAAYLASTAKLKTAPGGFVIAQADVLPPRVDIPTWSASRDGNTVTLAGFVASVEQQSAISEAAQAAMPGAVIVDQMQVARGINGDLEAVANYGLGQLANLSSGMVAVSGRDYSLSGEAATPAAFAATQDAQKNLTSSYGVVAQNVRPPAVSPFVWTATREGNAVTLTGLAASADARDRILAAAKAALPGLGIVDKTLVARGAPMGFEAMAGFGVKQLAHLSQGLVTASDQNFSIAGEAANAAAYEAATGGLKQLPSGFALVSEAIRLPLAKPYVFSMARADKQVILSGTLPSAAVQTAVRAAAKAAFPGATVTDTSTLARGASAGLDKAVTFGIGQLAQLAKGAFTLSDATYSISGDAASPAAFKAVNDELAKLPSPFAVGTANIVAPPPPPPPAPAPPPPPAPAPASPPAPAPAPGPVTTGPYGFEAVKEEGTLTLTGSYPDEKAHEDILDVVKHRFFNAKLDDKLAQQAGAPKNFVAAVTVALDQLARLATGKISLADTSLHVSGEALYDKAANEVQTTSAALLPPGFEVQTTVTARPVTTDLTAATCQEYLTGILGLGTIRFDSDSASIKAESFGLLDALAATAARCPSAKIEIAGHTDGVGNADYNKDLSVRRAQAVAVYLTKTGLALGTLTPVGYGLTHPIAPNDTEEGRAKNRRIDFVVK